MYLIAKDKLTASIGGEQLEELDVLLQVLQCLQDRNGSLRPRQKNRNMIRRSNLLLQQIFFLIPLNGGHDRGPDHAHSLRLGETVLLHILAQLGDDLLGALTLRDAVPQAALKLLIIEVEMRALFR